MTILSYLKPLLFLFLGLLLGLVTLSAGEVLTVGLWVVVLEVFVLGAVWSLISIKNPSLALGVIGALNPLSVIAVFTQSEFLFWLLVLFPLVVIAIQLMVFLVQYLADQKFGRALLVVLGLLLSFVLGFLVLRQLNFGLFVNDNFGISGLSLAYLQDIWFSYWSEPVLMVLMVVVLLLGVGRFVWSFVNKHSYVLQSVILITTVLLVTLLSLPIFSGNLVSPQYRVEEPVGWGEFVASTGGQTVMLGDFTFAYLPGSVVSSQWELQQGNIWLIQQTTHNNNWNLEWEGDLTPILQNLTGAQVVSEANSETAKAAMYLEKLLREDNLTPEVLAHFGVDKIVVIEGNDSATESEQLAKLKALSTAGFNEVESENSQARVFQFEINQEGFVLNDYALHNSPNDLVLDWEYSYSLGGSVVAKVNPVVDTKYWTEGKASLNLVSTESNAAQEISLNLNLNGETKLLGQKATDYDRFYAVVNDAALGRINNSDSTSLDLPSAISTLSSVRLYSRYATSDILALSDFMGEYVCGDMENCRVISTIDVETKASSLLELVISTDAGLEAERVCIYSLATGGCLASLDLSPNMSAESLVVELPEIQTQDLQIRLFADSTVPSAAGITNLSLHKYELQLNVNPSVDLKASWVSALQGEEITREVDSKLEAVELASYQSCDLRFAPEITQSVNLVDDGLEVKTNGEYCIGFQLSENIEIVQINGQFYNLQELEYADNLLIIRGEDDYLLRSLSFG